MTEMIYLNEPCLIPELEAPVDRFTAGRDSFQCYYYKGITPEYNFQIQVGPIL